MIVGVQPEHAHAWWPVVGEWISNALEHGGGLLNLDDVAERVANCDMQLWAIYDGMELKAACVTTITKWPRGSTLTAVAVGGTDMPTWVGELTDLLNRFALDNGCSMVDCHGRKGWAKFLPEHGWNEGMTTFRKKVTHG